MAQHAALSSRGYVTPSGKLRKADQKKLAEAAIPSYAKASEVMLRDLEQCNPAKRAARSRMVPRGGIEPPTPAFSVQCSTN
jgi:hypothetical protein